MMAAMMQRRWRTRAFQFALKTMSWLGSIPSKVTPAPFYLMQMGMAFWQSRVLYTAAQLGVADVLGDTVWRIANLAGELGVHEDRLYRLLRMLAALGVFEESAPGKFRNNKISQYLKRDHPHTVRPMILMHNAPQMVMPWFDGLEDAIRTGVVPFEQIHKRDLFAYMDHDKDFDALFAEAMGSVDVLVGDALVDDVNWQQFRRIIDMGGSRGTKTLAIVSKYPQLQAVVFDRPNVVALAEAHWRSTADQHVLERVTFTGGDLLKEAPRAASDRDAYTFFAVFHGWSDAQAEQALHVVRAAMGEHAAVLIIGEMVLPPCGADATVTAMDMQMLVNTHGRERVFHDWEALLNAADFTLENVHDTQSMAKIIIARPR